MSGIIPDLVFIAAIMVGIVAALYSGTVVWEAIIRPKMAMRAARRYPSKRGQR